MNYNFKDYDYFEYHKSFAKEAIDKAILKKGVNVKSNIYYEITVDTIDMPKEMVDDLLSTKDIVLCKVHKRKVKAQIGYEGLRDLQPICNKDSRRVFEQWYIPRSFFKQLSEKELIGRDYFKEQRIKQLTNTNIQI